MPGNHQFEAWCSQHQCHPTECFEVHNPAAKIANSLGESLYEAFKKPKKEKK